MLEAPAALFAFGAGLLSFLSPCVLPLIPSYLAFLSGLSPAEMPGRRAVVLANAVAFLAGFTVVFLALAALADAAAVLLTTHAETVRLVGGVLIALVGLATLGLLPLGILNRDARARVARKPAGLAGSALVGLAFAAGWTPCMGPILASVLVVAAQSPGSGLPLLALYVLGFSIPFLASAMWLGSWKGLRRHARLLDRTGGILMVAAGVLLATDGFSVLSRWLVNLTGFQGF